MVYRNTDSRDIFQNNYIVKKQIIALLADVKLL